jgi:hypothetical protein
MGVFPDIQVKLKISQTVSTSGIPLSLTYKPRTQQHSALSKILENKPSKYATLVSPGKRQVCVNQGIQKRA